MTPEFLFELLKVQYNYFMKVSSFEYEIHKAIQDLKPKFFQEAHEKLGKTEQELEGFFNLPEAQSDTVLQNLQMQVHPSLSLTSISQPLQPTATSNFNLSTVIKGSSTPFPLQNTETLEAYKSLSSLSPHMQPSYSLNPEATLPPQTHTQRQPTLASTMHRLSNRPLPSHGSPGIGTLRATASSISGARPTTGSIFTNTPNPANFNTSFSNNRNTVAGRRTMGPPMQRSATNMQYLSSYKQPPLRNSFAVQRNITPYAQRWYQN